MFGDDAQIYKAIGLAVAAARRLKGISQDQLASGLGLSRGSVSNIEAGRQKMLVHTLLQMAVYLGIPVTQLIPTANVIGEAVRNPEIVLNSNRPLRPSERDEVLSVLDRASKRNAE